MSFQHVVVAETSLLVSLVQADLHHLLPACGLVFQIADLNCRQLCTASRSALEDHGALVVELSGEQLRQTVEIFRSTQGICVGEAASLVLAEAGPFPLLGGGPSLRAMPRAQQCGCHDRHWFHGILRERIPAENIPHVEVALRKRANVE